MSFLPARVGFHVTALGEGVMPADSAVLCLAGLRCSLENLPPRSLPVYPGSSDPGDQGSSAMMTVHGAAHTLPAPRTPPLSPETRWAVL